MPDIVIRTNRGTTDMRALMGADGPTGPGADVTGAEIEAARDEAVTARVAAEQAAAAAEAGGKSTDAVMANRLADASSASGQALAQKIATTTSGKDADLQGQINALVVSGGVTPRGAFDSATAYSIRDLVTDAGVAYIAKAAIAAGAGAPASNAAWLAFPTTADSRLAADIDWLWRLRYQDGETAAGRRTDGKVFFPGLHEDTDATYDWLWRITYRDGETAVGRRTDGKVIFPGFVDNRLPGLIMVGDSLAEARKSAADLELRTLLGTGQLITNIGIGAQNATQIAARYGSTPSMISVTGNTIPASGSVTVTAESANMGKTLYDGTQKYVGILAGVPGELAMTTSGGNVTTRTFTRKSAGVAVPCPPGSPFQTGHDYRRLAPIIRIGRNGFKTLAPEALVALVRAALARTAYPEWAIVCSIPPDATETTGTADRTTLDAVNNALRDAFPTLWLDEAALLRSATIIAQYVGSPATSQDTTDIANGVTPTSFRKAGDPLHYNDAAYRAHNATYAAIWTARGLFATA